MSNRFIRRGFTLIELLLVIGIIAILAAIVIVAINPTKQLGDARDAQRRSDVNTILNAVYQYAIDNNGTIPDAITTDVNEICYSDGSACTGTGLISLSLLTGSYIVGVPADPQSGADCDDNGLDGTGYHIVASGNDRITVSAPCTEQTDEITVTR